MKNSGIEWIGEIPDDWELIKIGSIFACRNEKVSDSNYAPLSVSRGGVVPQMKNVAKSDAGDNRKLVLKEDFVINSRSDRKQSCGISSLDGSVSLINTVLYPIADNVICPQYTNLVMKNYGFAEEFYRWGHGIVADLWTTRWQEMQSIVLPIPPFDLQQQIADCLHKKCAAVERLITNQQEQIEKLKEYKQSVISKAVTKGLDPSAPLKDSGIEWIGNIPKSFQMTKIKNIGIYFNGLTYSPNDITDETKGTLVLRSSNIKNGKLILDDNVYVSCDIRKNLMVKKGDILVCSRNGSRNLIGKNAIIDKDICCSFGAFMMIFRCECSKYMYYILNSDIFNYYLGSFFTATINQLTGQNFGNMSVPFCSIKEEQKQITDYLDKKCTKIDRLISIKQQKIEKLQEYKKSLIYEYVTGKKEVLT